MKILAYGDAHVKADAPYSKPTEDGLTTHLQEILRWYAWLASVIEVERPDLVVELGDMFSSYGAVDVRSLTVGVEGVKCIQQAVDKIGAKFCFILGNHDIYRDLVHNVPFHSAMLCAKPNTICVQGHVLGLVPYGYSVEDITNDEVVVLFTHNDFLEIPFVTGRLPETGDSVHKAKANLIYNGHYHVPGAFDIGEKTLINVGSLGAGTFRDCGKKGTHDPVLHGARLIELGDNGSQIQDKLIPNPETSYYLTLGPGDHDKIDSIVNYDLAPRIKLRVETEIGQELVVDDKNLSYLDVVTLPVVGPSEASEDGCNGDAIDIDPLNATMEYLSDLRASGDVPESVDYDDMLKFVETLMKSVVSAGSRPSLPVKFLKVTGLNFLSLGKVSWDITSGLSAIVGINHDTRSEDNKAAENNGSGKTSLMELIFWTLTGETVREASGKDLMREGQKETYGILSVKVADSEYTIERKLVKDGRKVNQTLSVFESVNGADFVDVSGRLQEGSYRLVSELLNVGPKLLMHLIFLMGGLKNSFSKLGPLDRFRLFESLVGDLSVFDACASRVTETTTQVTRTLDTVMGELHSIDQTTSKHHAELQELDAKISALNSELDYVVKSTDAEISERELKLKQIEERKPMYSMQIEEAQRDLSIQQQARAQTSERAREITEKYVGLAENARKLIEECNARINDASARVNKINVDIGVLDVNIKREESLIDSGKCPTCGAETHTVERSSNVAGFKNSLQEMLNVRDGITLELQQYNLELEELSNNAFNVTKQKEEETAELNKAVSEIDDKIRVITSNINSLNQTVLRDSQLHSTYLREISELEAEKRNIEQPIQDTQKRKEFISGELNSLQERRRQAEAEKSAIESRLSMLRYLYNASAKSGVFSANGIRSKVMESILGFLNSRCNTYSDYLMPRGQNVRIDGSHTTQKGKVKAKLALKIEGSKRSYELLSAGESRRVDIILHLALRDLAQASSRFKTNLLAMDEILDPLDDAGLSNVLRLLDTFSGDTAVYVVTQNDRLRTELLSGILVEKRSGVSEIRSVTV